MSDFFTYEKPYYYIAVPLNNSESFMWDFIADTRDEIGTTINYKGKLVQIKELTDFEDNALRFEHLDKAIDWGYEHLPKLKLQIEKTIPGHFDWDKASIIKKEYTVVPLGKI